VAANLWIGLPMVLAAGILSGNCMLPMKFARRWPWEGTWLVFSIVSLIFLPWVLAFAFVPGICDLYRTLPASAFIVPFAFGVGWGIAQLLFGISISRLGLALGYAIIVGLGAVLGTLVPLFVRNRSVIASSHGALILSGVAVMALGIVVSAAAGSHREKNVDVRPVGSGYVVAIVVAVVCGLLAPMINYAFAFGQSIGGAAVARGVTPTLAGYAIWPVVLFGGFIPNVIYCAWLLTRNHTWHTFRQLGLPDLWMGWFMGLLWMGAFALYGVSSVYLGRFGTSVGWALFQIFMIMSATLSGVLTSEWKHAPRRAKQQFWTALALLAIATALIASGNQA